LKRFSLPRKERISGNRDFRRVLFKGTRIRSEYFEIRYLRSKLPHSRLGINVAKKTGSPVTRNRVKRAVREWYRLNKLDFENRLDLVFLFRRPVTPVFVKNMPDRFRREMIQAGILKP
jgi:ribonuclease P protein component